MNWTGPYKILTVGPGVAPDGFKIGMKLLYLDLPSDMPGMDQKNRVSVCRCKPCHNPHLSTDMPKYMPAGFSLYVLNSFADKAPPFHATAEDVVVNETRVRLDKITRHQVVRGRGGQPASLYETHWDGLLSVSWEREEDLRLFENEILLYWMGNPVQVKGNNSKYRAMRTGRANREYYRIRDLRYVTEGYGLVPYKTWAKK